MDYLRYSKNLKSKAAELRKNSTKAEIKLWMNLKGRQRCGFRFIRQKPIDRYIVDFYCKELRIAIEIDGASHDNEKYEYDKNREYKLEDERIEILRFSNNEVISRIDSVLRIIDDCIKKKI